MDLMAQAETLQNDLDFALAEAYEAIVCASLSLGSPQRVADAVPIDHSLQLQYRSVMGVELPQILAHAPAPKMEYGLSFSNAALDDCYLKFHNVKALIRRMAELETSVICLAEAIKKTRKRTNALSNIVIPEYNETIRRITDALEEKEREEFVKLKVVKKKSIARNKGPY
jgi:V/A-type H+-transporting ATPase subunit D